MSTSNPRVPISNRILAALPTKKYKDLLSNLQPVSLNLNQVLYDAGDPVRYVYFPNSAMISLVAIREDGGRSVEVGVVGEEGMRRHLASGDSVAHNKALVQLVGWCSALIVRLDA